MPFVDILLSFLWIVAVNTARPAAGAAHTGFKLRQRFFDSDASGLRFFARGHPTDPFVASQRGNVLPGG